MTHCGVVGAARPALKSPDDTMTLTEHLGELRVRIIRSALAVMVGAIVIIAFYDQVLEFLTRPYLDLCSGRERGVLRLRPGDRRRTRCTSSIRWRASATRLRVGMYGGLIVAMPVILWQVWRFIVPALHAKEKKYAIPFILSSIALFAPGRLPRLRHAGAGARLPHLLERRGRRARCSRSAATSAWSG